MAVLLINSVERKSSLADWAPVTITKTLNGRATASFTLNPGYIPDRFHSVLFYEADGTTVAFGGIVHVRNVKGVMRAHAKAFTRVDAVDSSLLFDYAFVTLAYQVSTPVEDIIADIVTLKLAALGFSYTPVATGEAIEPVTWLRVKAADIFRAISEATNLVVAVSPTLVITLVVPGDDVSPISVTTAAMRSSEISWRDDPKVPANKVILVCGSGVATASQDFVTDGLSHGGTTYYTVDYPVSQDISHTWPNLLYFDGVIQGPVSWGYDVSFAWWWDYVNGRLVHNESLSAIPTAGITITVGYTIQYPFVVESDTGASPVIETLEVREDILNLAYGQQIADGILAQVLSAAPATIATKEGLGVAPGQAFTVNITNRGTINATFLVGGVTQTIERQHRSWIVDLVPGDRYPGSKVDKLRKLLRGHSGSSSAATVSGSVSPSTTVLAPVHYSLGGSRQFGVAPSPAAWTAVLERPRFVARQTFSGEVTAVIWAKTAGITVKARLFNVTDTTDVESSLVTSTTPTPVTIGVDIVEGKEYELQILNGTNGETVYGIGTLDSL